MPPNEPRRRCECAAFGLMLPRLRALIESHLRDIRCGGAGASSKEAACPVAMLDLPVAPEVRRSHRDIPGDKLQ